MWLLGTKSHNGNVTQNYGSNNVKWRQKWITISFACNIFDDIVKVSVNEYVIKTHAYKLLLITLENNNKNLKRNIEHDNNNFLFYLMN